VFDEFRYRVSRSISRAVQRGGEAAARVGRALVAPIEWAFAATFGRAFRLLEHFERVEDGLAAVGRALAWPFRMAGRGVAAAALAIVPAGLRERLGHAAAAWHAWRIRAGQAAWAVVERLNLDGPARRVAWLLQPVWRPIAAVGGFLYAWAATRPYRRMAWAAPALLLLAPVLGATVWGVTFGRQSVAAQYREAAAAAREAKDLPRMQLLQRKLALLGVDSDHSDYEAALRLEKAGDLDEAYARMKLLAPAETLGYPQAHNWIIVHLLQNKLDVPADQRLALAEAHLKLLSTLGIKGTEMDLLRAVFCAQSGRLEEASALLAPMINSIELAARQRLEVDVLLGRTEEAKRDAHALKQHYEQAQRDGEAFDADRFATWAQCEHLLGNAEAFARVVRAWHKFDPASPAARQNVAAVDQLEFNEILQSPAPHAEELAWRLAEAMRLLEDTTPLEPDVARLWMQRSQAPAVARMFELLIAAADTPPALIGAIGTVAALSGDVPTARELLGRAVAGDPRRSAMWNNFAWSLSHGAEPDMARALDAANRALEMAPKEFRYRETRGQIYLALGRWNEAVSDLEFALNGMPDSAAIHRGLATAYQQLGQPELAAIHRQQAP
jgi:Flp pilus assembly protein TadD